jgi:hypothetical protein
MFHQNLKYITPDAYLLTAKRYALKNNYNPDNLEFSKNPKYKLSYTHNNKVVNFGNAEYNDYILYQYLEKNKIVEKGYAKQRRDLYLKRATNIKGNWKNNKYSPNNLAQYVLWDK